MELFYGKTKLAELEIRLRFLVCDQVESAFKVSMSHIINITYNEKRNHQWNSKNILKKKKERKKEKKETGGEKVNFGR